MAKLKLHEILDGYESSGGEEFVGKRFFRREITGSLTVSTSKKKKSKITRLAEGAGKILGYTNIRTYGFLFLTFGLLTVLFYFASSYLKDFLPFKTDISLIAGILFSIISVPMIVLDGPISQVLQEYLITDIIFFEKITPNNIITSEITNTIPIKFPANSSAAFLPSF